MIADSDLLDYFRAHADDLPTLRRLEKAAVAHVEQRTGRHWGLTETITEYLHWRGDVMSLGNIPAGGVVTSFESWDGTAFSAVDASAYYVEGSYIRLQRASLPYSAPPFPTRYKVVYEAGYAQGDDIEETDAPEDIRQAVFLLVGHWFENREAVSAGISATPIAHAVDALLSGHIKAVV